MKPDILIDEIRAARRRISARFGHDTRLLLDHYRALEEKYEGRILKGALEQIEPSARVQPRQGQSDGE
jgi:hypothetical protein